MLITAQGRSSRTLGAVSTHGWVAPPQPLFDETQVQAATGAADGL
jgi:hypothetical protein